VHAWRQWFLLEVSTGCQLCDGELSTLRVLKQQHKNANSDMLGDEVVHYNHSQFSQCSCSRSQFGQSIMGLGFPELPVLGSREERKHFLGVIMEP